MQLVSVLCLPVSSIPTSLSFLFLFFTGTCTSVKWPLNSNYNFICLDDKHRIKIWEPSFPVAAAEKGHQVLVSVKSSFQVGDYDFTCFSVVPSVCFIVDIPYN